MDNTNYTISTTAAPIMLRISLDDYLQNKIKDITKDEKLAAKIKDLVEDCCSKVTTNNTYTWPSIQLNSEPYKPMDVFCSNYKSIATDCCCKEEPKQNGCN